MLCPVVLVHSIGWSQMLCGHLSRWTKLDVADHCLTRTIPRFWTRMRTFFWGAHLDPTREILRYNTCAHAACIAAAIFRHAHLWRCDNSHFDPCRRSWFWTQVVPVIVWNVMFQSEVNKASRAIAVGFPPFCKVTVFFCSVSLRFHAHSHSLTNWQGVGHPVLQDPQRFFWTSCKFPVTLTITHTTVIGKSASCAHDGFNTTMSSCETQSEGGLPCFVGRVRLNVQALLETYRVQNEQYTARSAMSMSVSDDADALRRVHCTAVKLCEGTRRFWRAPTGSNSASLKARSRSLFTNLASCKETGKIFKNNQMCQHKKFFVFFF